MIKFVGAVLGKIGAIMRKAASPLLLILFVCSGARAMDGFDKAQCGFDIARALIGQRMSNEPTAAIEGRHTALGLRDLGGYEVSDHLFLSAWQVCGREFELILDDKSIVRDALQFPPHSKTSPGFVGACRVNDIRAPGTVIAIVENQVGTDMLAAQTAWKIDENGAKFVKLATDGLRCPRDGILTSDGGP